jgi:hypothetical protein
MEHRKGGNLNESCQGTALVPPPRGNKYTRALNAPKCDVWLEELRKPSFLAGAVYELYTTHIQQNNFLEKKIVTRFVYCVT